VAVTGGLAATVGGLIVRLVIPSLRLCPTWIFLLPVSAEDVCCITLPVDDCSASDCCGNSQLLSLSFCLAACETSPAACTCDLNERPCPSELGVAAAVAAD